MRNLVISLILLSVVLLSVGVVSAASDDSNLAADVNDEMAIGDSALDDEALQLSDDADDNDVIADSNEEMVGATDNVVTKDNFYNYFDNAGTLLDNVTSDELIFEGDFSDVGVNYVGINKPIKLTGDNAVFNGVSFVIDSDDVIIDGFSVTQSDLYLFGIDGKDNVTLSNNHINFATLEGYDGYAVYANCVSNFNFVNNTLIFTGNTDGTVVNNAILVTGDEYYEIASNDILIEGNVFDIIIPSVAVDYDPVTWEMKTLSEGIVFYYCEDVKFVGNNVNLRYNTVSGSYDTIYVVSVRGNPYNFDADKPIACDDVIIFNNTIIANGHTYIYGIYAAANDLIVSENNLNISADEYYANGIDIEGPSTGFVEYNYVHVASPGAAYGIYSSYYNGAVENMTYFNNTVFVNAYAACGMELLEINPLVSNNQIVSFGNYTYGVVASIRDNGTIVDNFLVAPGSNVGTDPTGDPVLPNYSIGLSVKGSTLIEDNVIQSTAYGVNLVEKGGMTLHNNNISVFTVGDVASYGIRAYDLNDLEILDNYIVFIGNTDGTFVNNAILVSGNEDKERIASNITVNDNKIDISIPSVPVYYDPVTWESTIMSEGIVFYYCEDVEFANNNVTLDYNDASGYYDTIYVVSVRGNPYNFDSQDPIACDDVIIFNNTIRANGHGYIYGICAAAEDLVVSENKLGIFADDYYANGIDIEGPSNGIVSDNNVFVSSPGTSYGIYSSYYNGAIEDMVYDNNIVLVDAYAACGMELLEINPVVSNNDITAEGNYTYGIVASIRDNGTISGNVISAMGSNVGNLTTGDSLLPFNSMGLSVKGSTVIKNNDIESSDYGVNLIEKGGITLENNNITVITIGDVSSYGIRAYDLNDLEIIDNNITFIGNTNGTFVNNAIFVSGNEDKERIASRITVDDNKIDISIPSVPVYYDPVTWESTVMSEGIVFYYCELVEFVNNDVTLKYNDASGYYDTIYVVSVRGNPHAEDPIACEDVIIMDNNIAAKGHGYIYGICAAANDLDISYNNLNIAADDYYANGIDVEGPSNGNVHHNNITVSSPGTAYGIYSSFYNGAVQDMSYFSNNVLVDAYAACGVELLEKNPVVLDNNITATGNYTYGIVASITTTGDIIGNNIVCAGSEVGDKATGDSLLPKNSIGISVKSDAHVEGNTVESTDTGIETYKANLLAEDNTIKAAGDYAIVLDDTSNATLDDNYLVSNKGAGSSAVTGGNKVTTSGNTPLNAILLAVDLTKVYSDAQQFTAMLVDQHGDALVNKTITLNVGGALLTSVTDENGVARFDIDLAGGNYSAISSFAGDNVYGSKSIENTIVVNTKATTFVATKTVTVLLTAIKKGAYYKFTLKDSTGKVLANKKVTIKFNGKTYTATTNANGLVSFKLVANKIGNQKLTMSFAGDENYTATSASAVIRITKEATKLGAANKAYKTNLKVKKYVAIVKDSKNKPVSKVLVTLKVNNKLFKVYTNAKGQAIFKVTNLAKKGKYAGVVRVVGNALYKPAIKKVVISAI